MLFGNTHNYGIPDLYGRSRCAEYFCRLKEIDLNDPGKRSPGSGKMVLVK
jgi:hypothetical protein